MDKTRQGLVGAVLVFVFQDQKRRMSSVSIVIETEE